MTDKISQLKGLGVAIITPFLPDGKIDFPALESLVDNLILKRVDYLVALGTTSESPTLTPEEKRDVVHCISTVNAGRLPLVMGVGGPDTLRVAHDMEAADSLPVDAFLSVAPYYNKPSQEGIYRHFAAVSKVGLPILVYNIQGRTGTNIATDTLARIADLPNIIGVKEASGNINQMADVLAKVKAKHPNFAVLSGDDGLTLPLLSLGGDGVVSVVSNLAPKEVKAMVDAGLKGKFDEARKAHFRLLPIFKAAFVDGNPTSIKYAMNLKGLPAGGVRAPLVEVNANAKKVIKAALQACKL